MSVTKGHMLISVLPTRADKETTHRKVYMHEDEPCYHNTSDLSCLLTLTCSYVMIDICYATYTLLLVPCIHLYY